MIDKHLCLVLQAAKGPGMQYPVAVTLKGGAAANAVIPIIPITLIELPPTRRRPLAGIGRKAPVFSG